MTPQLNGARGHHSGDINLVAALMSQGIPLDSKEPVRLIEGGPGPAYGSYGFGACSEDGTEDTERLMLYWNGHDNLEADHGFAQVCRFIRSRPRGLQGSEDLLGFAVTYLAERGHTMPGLRRLADVPQFVKALPHGEAAFVLAYVWNREICFQLHRNAKRCIYQTAGDGDQTRHALISTRLPVWQRTELLARLQG